MSYLAHVLLQILWKMNPSARAEGTQGPLQLNSYAGVIADTTGHPMCSVVSAIIPYELNGRRFCGPSLHAARSVLGATCSANSARNEGAHNSFNSSPAQNDCGRNCTTWGHCHTIPKQRKLRRSRCCTITAGQSRQFHEASNCSSSWKPREVGRGSPAVLLQQRLLLVCLRSLRYFRVVWQWSLCISFRAQSFL